jgi:type II secretory pathway pseudopilin PulG
MIPYTHTKAFTIVETLVAISVLMIAIAGPLVVASKGLTSAVYSKNQMTASYLAQESMEIIKNRRDNNMVNGDNWLDDMEFCQGPAGGNYCDAGLKGSSGEIILEACPIPLGCSLDLNTNMVYTHNTRDASKAPFYRYFYLEDLGLNNGNPEFVAHVFVNWIEGKIPFQIHLTSTLVNVNR